MENNEKRSKLQFLHFFYDFSIGYFKKIESLPLATAWNRIRLDNKSLWPRWKKEEVTNIHTAQTLFAKHNSPDSASFSCYFENDFPESIRQNKSLSPVLYYLGNIALFSGTSVCVVGSRNPSAFGIATTRKANVAPSRSSRELSACATIPRSSAASGAATPRADRFSDAS